MAYVQLKSDNLWTYNTDIKDRASTHIHSNKVKFMKITN